MSPDLYLISTIIAINTVSFDGCSLVSMKRKGKCGGNRNLDSPAPKQENRRVSVCVTVYRG